MSFHKPIAPRNFAPERLRMALGLRCLSRQEFAKQSGIPDESLRPLCLRGEFPEPDNQIVERIAKALDFPPGFFYQGSGDNTLGEDTDAAEGITWRRSPKGPWEILCDRCDDVVAKGVTEAIAYKRATQKGLVRGVKVHHERWDLCARCFFETGGKP